VVEAVDGHGSGSLVDLVAGANIVAQATVPR